MATSCLCTASSCLCTFTSCLCTGTSSLCTSTSCLCKFTCYLCTATSRWCSVISCLCTATSCFHRDTSCESEAPPLSPPCNCLFIVTPPSHPSCSKLVLPSFISLSFVDGSAPSPLLSLPPPLLSLSLPPSVCLLLSPPSPSHCLFPSPFLSPPPSLSPLLSLFLPLIFILQIPPQEQTRPLLANPCVNFHMHNFHTLASSGGIAAHHPLRRLGATRAAHMEVWKRHGMVAPASRQEDAEETPVWMSGACWFLIVTPWCLGWGGGSPQTQKPILEDFLCSLIYYRLKTNRGPNTASKQLKHQSYVVSPRNHPSNQVHPAG